MNANVNWELVIFLLFILYAIIIAACIDIYISKLLYKNKIRKELHKLILVLFAIFFPFVGAVLLIKISFNAAEYMFKSLWTIFNKGIYEE